MKILIIEDEKLLADSIKTLLTKKVLRLMLLMTGNPEKNMRNWESTIY